MSSNQLIQLLEKIINNRKNIDKWCKTNKSILPPINDKLNECNDKIIKLLNQIKQITMVQESIITDYGDCDVYL